MRLKHNQIEAGIDIIEIDRIAKVIARRGERFLKRAFTEREIAYCQGRKNWDHHFAARFAAKEATFKCLTQTAGRDGIKWIDIEILNDTYGKPYVKLHGKAKDMAKKIKLKNILLTLSHSDDYAVAQVILLKTQTKDRRPKTKD